MGAYQDLVPAWQAQGPELDPRLKETLTPELGRWRQGHPWSMTAYSTSLGQRESLASKNKMKQKKTKQNKENRPGVLVHSHFQLQQGGVLRQVDLCEL